MLFSQMTHIYTFFLPKFIITKHSFIYNKRKTSKTMRGGDEKEKLYKM